MLVLIIIIIIIITSTIFIVLSSTAPAICESSLSKLYSIVLKIVLKIGLTLFPATEP